jgi:hypothetical protein
VVVARNRIDVAGQARGIARTGRDRLHLPHAPE